MWFLIHFSLDIFSDLGLIEIVVFLLENHPHRKLKVQYLVSFIFYF